MMAKDPENALPLSQNLAWYQALTLTERRASLQKLKNDAITDEQYDVELAMHRMRKWRNQPPFENDYYFADLLAAEHLTEEEFTFLLGEPTTAIVARTASLEWLHSLMQAFKDYDKPQDFIGPKQNQKLSEFLKPLSPLLKQSISRLYADVQTIANQHTYVPFDVNTFVQLLFPHLVNQLLPIATKVLTLELNIARLQGKLQGDTPEARFHSFIEQLCVPETMVTLLENYPVMARTLVTIADHWVNYNLEFCTHLCTDWQEICGFLSPGNDPGMLEEIRGGAGDTHRQGRSVMQLKFSSGFRILYKPRSLAIDIHFQKLLDWLNERGDHPPLCGVKVIDKSIYGWSEFVEAHSCDTEVEIEHFYERQGGFLALLYIFESTDFHHENLIASGEYPMLIDLESLLQPHFPVQSDENTSELPLAIKVLQNSVLRSGLLPNRSWSNAGKEGIDLSGLGGKGGQLTPGPIPILSEIGTDQMRLIRQRIEISDQQNRPQLNDSSVDILDYMDHIVKGFDTIYHLLMKYREELLTNILPIFAHDEVRVIVRPTRTYARLLQESVHPSLLRNALTRDRFFDHLWGPIRQYPYLARIIAAEREDLLVNDIPLFTSYTDLPHIYSSGGVCIAEFFDEPCFSSVQRRIQQLDERDLSRQLWIIRASFATVTAGSGKTTWKHTHLRPSQTYVTRERFIQTACAIGDRLCELALQSDNEVSWLGLQMRQEQAWNMVTSLDIYSGSAGICIFLAYLGSITSNERYTILAQLTLQTIQQQKEILEDTIVQLGAFEGWGAFLYLYTHLGVLWNKPELLVEAEELVEVISKHIEKDDILDVVGGSAGCIYSLLNLHQIVPSLHTLQVAIQCGDHLLSRVKELPKGVGWLTPMATSNPLTGFSHGTAGIGLSLLKLAEISSEQRFKETALAAIAYERSVFSSEKQNWPDLRDTNIAGITEKDRYNMVTWCHGAPGIGLARLETLRYISDPQLHEEIMVALKTTRESGFGFNHSLCHGDLGNLDVLLTASQILKTPSSCKEVKDIAAMILDSIEEKGWHTGVPLSIETPGLMTGIAGIGYELLRLAEPEKVPSVLLLAPPFKSDN